MRDVDFVSLTPEARAQLLHHALEPGARDSSPDDRLTLAYDISDLARHVSSMAQELSVAESVFESDLSDLDLAAMRTSLAGIMREMEKKL